MLFSVHLNSRLDPMLAKARCLLALRCIAAALLFESGFSFPQLPCLVRENTLLRQRCSAHRNEAHHASSPLPPHTHTYDRGECPTFHSQRGNSWSRPRIDLGRQRRRRKPPQPSLIALSAVGTEENDAADAASPSAGMVRAGDASATSNKHETAQVKYYSCTAVLVCNFEAWVIPNI